MRLPRGFTLIELMVTLTVLAILLALAVPGFADAFRRHRLIGAAETLASSLNYAKSESLYRSENVVLSLRVQPDQAWCYGLANGKDECECTTDSSCKVGDKLKVVKSTEYPGVVISSETDIQFTPARGGVSASAEIELVTNSSLTMRVTVSEYGMIRLCSPSGSGKVFGFEDC